VDFIFHGCIEALRLIGSGDREFLGIVATSLEIALLSTLLAAFIGIPCGMLLAIHHFWGKSLLERLLDTLLSMPTVLIGLVGYAFLSRQGPLGELNLLYTKSAIIIGQTILIIPLITALTNAAMGVTERRYRVALLAVGANRREVLYGLLREGKTALSAAVLTGFGRVFSEVGIAMMLGGNIRGYTRTITTAIALETGRGEFSQGIALGIVLLLVSGTLALGASFLRRGR